MIGSIEGVVVEITQSNTVRIRLPRDYESVPAGIKVNPDGIIEVGLATLNLPKLSNLYEKILQFAEQQ